MEELSALFENLTVDKTWLMNLDQDIETLARVYANEAYEFIHYKSLKGSSKQILIDYLLCDNHARNLLIDKIRQLFPSLPINIVDIDSIMDTYINCIELC